MAHLRLVYSICNFYGLNNCQIRWSNSKFNESFSQHNILHTIKNVEGADSDVFYPYYAVYLFGGATVGLNKRNS